MNGEVRRVVQQVKRHLPGQQQWTVQVSKMANTSVIFGLLIVANAYFLIKSKQRGVIQIAPGSGLVLGLAWPALMRRIFYWLASFCLCLRSVSSIKSRIAWISSCRVSRINLTSSLIIRTPCHSNQLLIANKVLIPPIAIKTSWSITSTLQGLPDLLSNIKVSKCQAPTSDLNRARYLMLR